MADGRRGGEGVEAGPLPVLGSARLVLRPVVPGDADAVRRLADDLAVSRWLSRVPHPYGPAEAAQFVHEIAPREPVWAVERRGGGLAGVGGFAPRWMREGMELGQWLGRPAWGLGLATEAAGLMLAEAWRRGVASVGARHDVDNARSRRVLDKLGFVAVGRATGPCLALGRDVPVVVMRLGRPDGA